ncbi:hypothetical protein ACPC54_23800 [Kitasatospora sp. NPDC094028]
MTSAYQQQLAQQLRAAEDELGRLRRLLALLITERDSAQQAVSLWFGTAVEAGKKHQYAKAAWQSTIVEARRQAARAARVAEDGNTETLKAYAQLRTANAERDGAYRERAHLTAWLATIHPAVIAPAADVEELGWQILYITAGGRQLSWHIHPRDADLYRHVERVTSDDPRAQWDGHTTEQKYAAISEMSSGRLAGAATAEARIAAVRALAADMRTWCSPHGIAVHYADHIDEVLDRTAP